MVKNPFYTGRLKYRGADYQGSHQPIVDISLYEAVLAARRPLEKREKGSQKAPRTNVLVETEGN